MILPVKNQPIRPDSSRPYQIFIGSHAFIATKSYSTKFAIVAFFLIIFNMLRQFLLRTEDSVAYIALKVFRFTMNALNMIIFVLIG